MPQPATDPGVYLFCEGIGCSCPTGFDKRHDRYQTDNRLRIVRKSEWKSVTSFVHSAEVRNNSCGYHLSNSSTVFTDNAVNMDLSSSPGSDSENTCRFFKHFCFCAPCSTVGAVPLLKLSRNRQSANVKVLYFVGSDQKCGTKFPACYAYWWQNKKKKQFFLVSRQVLSFKKKSPKTKNWFNSPVCVLEIFDLLPLCVLQGTHNNNSLGRYNFITFRIMSLVKSRRKND